MLQEIKEKLANLFGKKDYSNLKINDFFESGNSLELNWKFISGIPEFAAMKTTNQSTIWHKEGNVWNHTQLVCENMQNLLNDLKYGFTDFHEQRIMMTAALCHDLGKVPTTVYDETTQQYKTERHGVAGEKITRKLLWNENIIDREKVCFIVRYHMDLHHVLMKSPDSIKATFLKYFNGMANINMMNLMCLADSLGSINDEESNCQKYEHYDKVKTTYDSFGFAAAERDSNVYVSVLIGLPGSGKDTFAARYLLNRPVLSRDDIREEIGMTVPGKKVAGSKQDEKKVTEIFNKRLLEYIKAGKSVVISNTNLNKKTRKTYRELLKDYNPTINMVYIEPAEISVCKERREDFMPVKVIDDMWNRFEFPTGDEYDMLIIYKQNLSGDELYTDVHS